MAAPTAFQFKVCLWSPAKTHLHVFLGQAIPEDVAAVLTTLEPANAPAPTPKQEVALRAAFGPKFAKVLGLQKSQAALPKTYHTTTFYSDDTVAMFRKKVCHALGLSSPNEMYLWYMQAVDATVHHTFVKNTFRADGRTSFATFSQKVKAYYGYDMEESAGAAIIDRAEAVRLLTAANIRKVAEPLCFKYFYDTFVEYMCYDPRRAADHPPATSSLSLQTTLALLMHNFQALDDTYYVHMRKGAAAEVQEAYYPLGDPNPLDAADKKFLRLLQDTEQAAMDADAIPEELTSEHNMNYVQIKGNDTGLNRSVNMEVFFQALSASAAMPFIKMKTQSNAYYKVHAQSLPRIPKEDLDKWTHVSTTRDDRAYVLCKLSYHERSFCTVHVYQDLSFQVKFNMSIKDKESLASVRAFLGKHVQPILALLRQCYPSSYIPELSREVLESAAEADIVHVAQMILSSKITTGQEIKYAAFPGLIREKFFPYFNIIDTKDPTILHLQYKKVNNYTKMNNLGVFIYQHLAMEPADLVALVMMTFMVSKEEAEREIESWKIKHTAELQKKGKDYIVKMRGDNFVNVKIRLSSPLELKFLTNGVTDYGMYLKIEHLLKALAAQSSTAKAASKATKKAKELEAMVDAQEAEAQEAADAFMNFKDLEELGGLEAEEDMEDGGIDAADLLDFEKMFEEEMAKADDPKPAAAPAAGPAQSPTAPAASPKAGTKKLQAYFLTRLREADRELFDYKVDKKTTSKRDDYPSLCQWVDRRQPVVVEKHELDRIQKEHPRAIDGYVKTGSTGDLWKKNFYICPSIWCPKSRVALSYQEYAAAKKQGACPLPNEEPILFSSKTYWGKTSTTDYAKKVMRDVFGKFFRDYCDVEEDAIEVVVKKGASETKIAWGA